MTCGRVEIPEMEARRVGLIIPSWVIVDRGSFCEADRRSRRYAGQPSPSRPS
jgi:hypothetical protein